jgi:hypothetical protein
MRSTRTAASPLEHEELRRSSPEVGRPAGHQWQPPSHDGYAAAMRHWVLTFNPPTAIVVVWAQDVEEARRLAVADLADKAPGIEPTETAAAPLERPATSGVVFSSITTVD